MPRVTKISVTTESIALRAFSALRLVESKTYKGGALGLRYEPTRK